ncbi:MAG: protein kinase [Labilithrix sp.]|nr:protein kinase [Labilithrix sp.]
MSEASRGDAKGNGAQGVRDEVAPPTVVRGHAPTSARPATASDEPIVPGYDLVRVLGRGGMGVVWEAIEGRLDRAVALKVHRSSALERGQSADALWTEALVAARIGDPSIVRVLDVGYTLDERPYYAMELVHGSELGALIADGALAPRRAVDIAADMARAAAAAHAHGVIHRDLKPRNVIVDGTGRARVCDFGIAFDARRGDDPYAGMLAGSPPYMAPEQVLGRPIGPQTDIWAIGVMLYEMLTGERPFVGATVEELLAAIGADDPPPPSARREGIHADLDAVVGRCLTKASADRFPSAAALFETLSAISEGRSIEIAAPSAALSYAPKVSGSLPAAAAKPRRDDAKKRLAWSWRLRSAPDALWSYVADTDRFNEAVGLAPVTFTDEPRPDGGVKRTGELRVLGLNVTWREYPFEWVWGREHSVFRWYGSGPLAALWNKVTLAPLEGGGTELRHDIWLSPRGVIGQLAAFVEIDRKLAPAVDRFYRHLDDVLCAGGRVDPFEAPFVPTPEQRALVEAGCARLHAEGFAPSLVEKLAMHLLAAPDGVMTTLRPYELADAWSCERAETLDAFIHAAHAGILEPVWDVVCPRCMIAHESRRELGEVTKHGSCAACATSFERDLAESVELVFAPHPSVRSVQRQTFCAGSPAKRPHVVAQQVLEPGEVRRVTMRLPRGTYRVAGAVATAPWEVVASAVGFEERCDVASDGDRVEGRPAILKAGTVTFVLRNAGTAEETFRVEIAGARNDAVSAAAALTHPTFRAFFSEQLVARGEHLRVRHLAFLFVELVSREALFDAVGDGAACAELARLDAMVLDAARAHEGEVVPSSLAIFVVGFATTLRAVRAALALERRVAEVGFGAPVAIAVHDGRCIALTRAGKPEFFGETLHRGEALLGDCPAAGIALSPSVMADRAVAVAVHESGLSVTVDQSQRGPYAGRRVTLLLP